MNRLCAPLLLFFLVFTFDIMVAAFEQGNQGSRSAAMGNSLVAVSGEEWSAFVNPAVLKTISERTVSLFYAPQPFELKELARAAASFVEPTGIGTFGLSASRYGFELYRETRIALSYAGDLATIVKGGVTINYYSLSIRNYGSASTFGVDLGLLVDVSDNIHWGFAASNLNAPTIGTAKEKLPQIFSTGISFNPIAEGTIAVSVVKDIRYSAEVHVGIEYAMMEMVALRAGTTSDPNTLNAGVGIWYSFAEFDYAFSSHSELGMTHQFSLSLKLGEL
jgi:hypothetical protein